MKIAKHFRWEAAHRLPWHKGLCRNLHGHSYHMTVELEGDSDEWGIVMDFKVLKHLVAPLVDRWDHAMLIAESDEILHRVAEQTGWKHNLLPFDSTAENLSTFVAEYLAETHAETLLTHRVHTVRVRISETESCYAEAELPVKAPDTSASSRHTLAEVTPGG